jgi:hypothetical protein
MSTVRLEAKVYIEVVLDVDGHLKEPKVVAAVPPHASLIYAALEGVRTWTYSPALLNGVEIPVVWRIQVTFDM